jgi:hypothetical protein
VSTPNTRPAASAKQRRSQRVLLSVRLEVSGKRTNGVAFIEDTSTLIVNAHGGLLLLKEVVAEGQLLTLKHTRTTEETSCTVMNIGPKTNGLTEVGVEFSKPNSKFWRVSFPPEDWTPHSPDAKPVTFNPRSVPVLKPQPAKK